MAARTVRQDITPVIEISQKVGLPIEVCTFIGSSPIRQYAEGWDLARMVKLTEDAVSLGVKNGLPVMYVTEDTTRADPETLRRLYSTAIRAGASRVCIADTVGHATPAGAAAVTRFIGEVVRECGGHVGIDWHGHRDRDLAIVFQVELRQSTKYMERFSSTLLQDYLKMIRDTIADGQADGSFRADVHATVAAKIFFGALDDVMDVAQAKAETIRLGAGEAMLRWFVMPHLSELMSGDPPLRFEVHSLTTESALRELLAGSVDLVIVRTDSVPDGVRSEVVKTVQYILAVPRTFLRSREAAEVFEGRPLPFAELAGDGHFAKTVEATATTLGLNLRPVLKAQTFSLLVSAVESGTAAAFLPEVAAKSLPEQNFALVSAEGMGALHRRLSLAWTAQVLESRPAVRHAVTRLKRVLAPGNTQFD